LQASFAITPVDSTGAGDTFCGALCAALCQGHDMDQALRYASAAAALACTRLGAQSSIPDAAEVATLLAAQTHNNTFERLAALRALCGLN
jgi:ribokinase